MERKRKQNFAFLCIAFIIIASVVFAIVDFIEKDKMEFVVDILVIVFVSSGMLALMKSDEHRGIYRVGFVFLSLAFLYNTVIGAGNGTAVYWLFPFPLALFFFFGKKEGCIFVSVFFCVLCIILINPFSFKIYDYGIGGSLRFLASFLLVTLMAHGLESSREKFGKMFVENHTKLMEEKQNLKQAQGRINTLSGLIPICCHCKKIRNDEGYWQQVEVYVRDHTQADFSHGICPDCAETLYKQYKVPDSVANPNK